MNFTTSMDDTKEWLCHIRKILVVRVIAFANPLNTLQDTLVSHKRTIQMNWRGCKRDAGHIIEGKIKVFDYTRESSGGTIRTILKIVVMKIMVEVRIVGIC